MNLLDAIAADHARLARQRVELAAAERATRTVLDQWTGAKIASYFHDCLPGCQRESPNPVDHVSLPPRTVPTCRCLYPKHLALFAAGTARERLFLKANRAGGTDAGAFEATLHLTGLYDDYAPWWQGRRFKGPIQMWAAGDTGKTTRDILQEKLLGPPNARGTGMIPGHLIVDTSTKQGVPDAIESVWVRHVPTGGVSLLQLKSFDQRREAFQGTAQHVVWLDEECDEAIYTEALLRTAATSDFEGGCVLLTFTPLKGLTPLVLSFLPGGSIDAAPTSSSKRVVVCGWDDVPHLTLKDREELLASVQPFQRDARSKGVPQLGAGAVYPVPESSIVVEDFEIPKHWPRAYGMDAGGGANPTAAVWLAQDRDSGVFYAYSAYKAASAEPAIHASAIKARGSWIPGVGDCAALIMTTADAEQLVNLYKRLGLDLTLPDKAVETGIQEVWELFSTGRLKVFRYACAPLLEELRVYRRDEKGRIVKQSDHCCDALRYVIRSGRQRMRISPASETKEPEPRLIYLDQASTGGLGWMGR